MFFIKRCLLFRGFYSRTYTNVLYIEGVLDSEVSFQRGFTILFLIMLVFLIIGNNLFKAFHHCYTSKPSNVDILELVKLYELVSASSITHMNIGHLIVVN